MEADTNLEIRAMLLRQTVHLSLKLLSLEKLTGLPKTVNNKPV